MALDVTFSALFLIVCAMENSIMRDSVYKNKNRLLDLKERSARCKCKFCGSALELRRIVFSDFEEARIELFCPECDRIEYGVEPEIYQGAEYFVDALKFNHYPELSQNEQTRKMNIAKVCEIMNWMCRNFGFTSEHGFAVPISVNNTLLGEALVLTDDELDARS